MNWWRNYSGLQRMHARRALQATTQLVYSQLVSNSTHLAEFFYNQLTTQNWNNSTIWYPCRLNYVVQFWSNRGFLQSFWKYSLLEGFLNNILLLLMYGYIEIHSSSSKHREKRPMNSTKLSFDFFRSWAFWIKCLITTRNSLFSIFIKMQRLINSMYNKNRTTPWIRLKLCQLSSEQWH